MAGNQSTEALPTENDLPFVTDNLENERYWRIVQKDWRAASGQGMRIMNKVFLCIQFVSYIYIFFIYC